MDVIKDVSYQGVDFESSPSLLFCFVAILASAFGYLINSLKNYIVMLEEDFFKPEISFPELLITDGPEISPNDIPIAHDVYSSTYRTKYKNKLVCIKIWRRNSMYSPERQRFIRNLERALVVWRGVSHPNLDPLCGMMLFSNFPALVTPYHHNGNINRYISQHPDVDRTKLLEGVATGLRHLHALNPPVSHGDVRGCNILITDNGTPVLSHIGLAQLPLPPDWTVGIDEGLRWMAPEVMNPSSDFSSDSYDSCPTTPMSDVYSYGMLMLEIYTGRPPYSHRRFHGGVILEIMDGIKPPRPSTETCPALTDEIWDVIQSCWDQEPSHRPMMEAVVSWLRLISRVRRQQV